MENLFIDCWLLDAVDDDFAAIWELASVLQQRQPTISEDGILYQLSSRLSYLYDKNFIKFYQGIIYNGDEIEITATINSLFIKEEVSDVFNYDIHKPIIKIYVTEIGRVFYLSQCKSSLFD